jgi:tetratricopeptide (TPR) repeat protein
VQSYGVRDVLRLLGLSRNTLRALIGAGFVTPARGPRNAWQFSFQDLIVLRTAQALVDAKVPQRRITRSLRELRRHLPASMPLSGLAISAIADRVVVREGGRHWQAESGQYLLAFDGDPAAGSLNVLAPATTAVAPPGASAAGARACIASAGAPAGGSNDATADARSWFARAAALERDDATAAMDAYERALAAEPGYVDARINLGRLLHDTGRLGDAERVYRVGVRAGRADPVLLFNLGVLLEDLDRLPEAVDAYESALRADPQLADGHFNVALLYEKLAQPREALRHMARYRTLTQRRPG